MAVLRVTEESLVLALLVSAALATPIPNDVHNLFPSKSNQLGEAVITSVAENVPSTNFATLDKHAIKPDAASANTSPGKLEASSSKILTKSPEPTINQFPESNILPNAHTLSPTNDKTGEDHVKNVPNPTTDQSDMDHDINVRAERNLFLGSGLYGSSYLGSSLLERGGLYGGLYGGSYPYGGYGGYPYYGGYYGGFRPIGYAGFLG